MLFSYDRPFSKGLLDLVNKMAADLIMHEECMYLVRQFSAVLLDIL